MIWTRMWGGSFRFLMLMLASVLSLPISGCEHDPTVLETHPLDLTGATRAGYQSIYLTMSDGVRIAMDVAVPEDYPGGKPLPTILEMTRYWRRRGGDLPYTVSRALQRGFVWIAMDERGTGASFGEWPEPLTARAILDAREVIDWIVDQTWSNGYVGATGISYPGSAAQQMAAAGHPALRAIVPMSDTYDLYGNLVFPGGVFNQNFLQGWSDVVYALDRNSSLSVDGQSFVLSPVDEDPNGELLEEAIAGHAGNLEVFQAIQDITYRDDLSLTGFTLDEISTRAVAPALEDSGVEVYQWGSWLDAGSADGVIRGFMDSSGPRRATVGSWTHDLSSNAFNRSGDRWTPNPSFEAQWDEALNFFDDRLRKGKPAGDRVLRYFTMGEGLWKETATWPIPGTVMEPLFLGEDGSLARTPPTDPTGEDMYEVDFTARSSIDPRWLAPLFTDTWYSNRLEEDLKLLVYQTPPLTGDLEVTGYPVVHLNLSSTHDDGTFIVYLEDVSPQGIVTYITEGVLRGIHRRVTEEPGPWKRPIPYHSYLAADSEPLVPGQVTDLSLALEPTSFLFREGHRIRIAIAGHDTAAFRRIPESGTPILRVQRNSLHPSFLELPVVAGSF